MPFSDHFSDVAPAYARFRPGYPDELFRELERLSPSRALAWDCATGSGQAATRLAAHFDDVIASDASTKQLSMAARADNICYVCAEAERAPIASRSVDLVAVAQALHWLEIPRFFSEVARVAVEGALVAAWTYGAMRITPEVDAIVHRFQTHTVGSYWPPQRRLVDDGYASIEFPFQEIIVKPMFMERTVVLSELTGYLRTWSATQRYQKDTGRDPVTALTSELLPVWGSEKTVRLVRWPLSIRAGYVQAL